MGGWLLRQLFPAETKPERPGVEAVEHLLLRELEV